MCTAIFLLIYSALAANQVQQPLFAQSGKTLGEAHTAVSHKSKLNVLAKLLRNSYSGVSFNLVGFTACSPPVVLDRLKYRMPRVPHSVCSIFVDGIRPQRRGERTTEIRDAAALLSQYDAQYRAALVGRVDGLRGATAANEWVFQAHRPPLAAAVKKLSKAVGKVQLGICADNTATGLATLKLWVTTLGLPQGLLYGLDKDGELDMSLDGPVYIKYLERSYRGNPAGTSKLSAYDSDFRGVHFNVDGMQYGALPLDLFTDCCCQHCALAAHAVGDVVEGSNTRHASCMRHEAEPPEDFSEVLAANRVRKLLHDMPMLHCVRALGVTSEFRAIDEEGVAHITCIGPPGSGLLVAITETHLRRLLAKADPRLRHVEIIHRE